MAPSMWQILIVLLIVLLIFGTKKLRNMGGDLGGAIKGFKNAMKDGEAEAGKNAGKLTGGEGSTGEAKKEQQHDKV